VNAATSRKPDTAATFRVGVWVAPVNGGGWLTVAPGAITLDAGRVTRGLSGVRRIVQTDREVTLVTARLVPPWFNTSLMVSDGRTAAQVSMPIGARGRLRAALDEAGFDVRETATWFSPARTQPEPGRPRPADAQLPVPRFVLALATVFGGAVAVLVVSHSPTFVAIVVASVLLSAVSLRRR
jgi:hypothetical protein